MTPAVRALLQNQIIRFCIRSWQLLHHGGAQKNTQVWVNKPPQQHIIWLLWMFGDEMFFPDYRIHPIWASHDLSDATFVSIFSSNIRDTASENFSSIFLFPPFLESICIQEMITIWRSQRFFLNPIQGLLHIFAQWKQVDCSLSIVMHEVWYSIAMNRKLFQLL